MICLQSSLAAKAKGTKSSVGKFQFLLYDMGYRYHSARMGIRGKGVTEENCSEKARVFPGCEFVHTLIGNGSIKSL